MMIRPALREYRTWTSDSRRWQAYEPRPGDIIIATAPKCGTTWMQQIVGSLIFQDAEMRPLPDVSPWIKAAFSVRKRICTGTSPRRRTALPQDAFADRRTAAL